MVSHESGLCQRALSFTVVALSLLSFGPLAPAGAQQLGVPDGDVQDWFLEVPLPAGAEQYRDIDGRRMQQYVVEQAEIARRYRDQGSPQSDPRFWGRVIASSADAEGAEWLAGKFRAASLSDVRIQKLDLDPQWFPQTWTVTLRSGGRTVELTSAQPFYRANGTPSGGLDVEAVYVGLGTEADFAGRDVAGKAVFSYSMQGLPNEGAWRRAEEKGAAVVFDVHMLPGNIRYQAYPPGTEVPAFTVGGDDGFTLREMIETGQPVRASVHMDIEMVPDLETALVWGSLPGATDETIYVIAHRDGWFDASGDNASGVATMIGLAEHYAAIPQAQRRRTMIFVGTDGHHNSGTTAVTGLRWMREPAQREALFGKTALMINAEHTSAVQTTVRPRYIRGTGPRPSLQGPDQVFWTNTYVGQQWYAGGPSRPVLEKLSTDAFREFGVTTYADPNPRPPAGECGGFSRFLPCVATSEFYHYFHSEHETPETVPWTGLETTTRSYARIIDEVNKLELSDLQRPPEEG